MAILIRKKDVDEALQFPQTPGKHLLESFQNRYGGSGISVKILEDAQVSDNEAEIHDNEKDVWLVLQGNPVFCFGGELVEKREVKPGEWKAKEIRNGETVTLASGDWLEIPAGEPHQHNCPDGVARMVIIKIPK